MAVNGEAISRWVQFGLFLLFALISPYIARMLFGVLVSLQVNGRRVPALFRLQVYLLGPVTQLMAAAFLYLCVFVSFNDFWEQRYVNALAMFLYDVLLGVLKLYVLFVSIWTLYRTVKYLSELFSLALRVYGVAEFSRPVLIEAATLLLAVLLVVACVYLLLVLAPGAGVDGTSSQVVSLLTSLNWITMSLVIGFTPVLRDIFAGLTLLADGAFGPNELVRLQDVSKLGFVKDFGLRLTAVRCLDQSIEFVPNSKFLRYPLISYTKSGVTLTETHLPLSRDTPPATLRELLLKLQQDLRTQRAPGAVGHSIGVGGSADAWDALDTPRLPGEATRLPTPMPSPSSTSASGGDNTAPISDNAHWRAAVADPHGFSVTCDEDFNLVICITFWDTDGIAALKYSQSETLLYLTEILAAWGVRLRGRSWVSYRSLRPKSDAARTYTD